MSTPKNADPNRTLSSQRASRRACPLETGRVGLTQKLWYESAPFPGEWVQKDRRNLDTKIISPSPQGLRPGRFRLVPRELPILRHYSWRRAWGWFTWCSGSCWRSSSGPAGVSSFPIASKSTLSGMAGSPPGNGAAEPGEEFFDARWRFPTARSFGMPRAYRPIRLRGSSWSSPRSTRSKNDPRVKDVTDGKDDDRKMAASGLVRRLRFGVDAKTYGEAQTVIPEACARTCASSSGRPAHMCPGSRVGPALFLDLNVGLHRGVAQRRAELHCR